MVIHQVASLLTIIASIAPIAHIRKGQQKMRANEVNRINFNKVHISSKCREINMVQKSKIIKKANQRKAALKA